ncbi:MAG: response regulator [Bacteriovorax sp.]|nr:response regulator [Rhizobacter sp.]
MFDIDDSIHVQKLAAMLVRQHVAGVDLQVADDGIAGLAMCGKLEPLVLIVDILLLGIDGATLISSLRSHPPFAGSHRVVASSLSEARRAPRAHALEHAPVIRKPRLAVELPALLAAWLPASRGAARAKPGVA